MTNVAVYNSEPVPHGLRFVVEKPKQLNISTNTKAPTNYPTRLKNQYYEAVGRALMKYNAIVKEKSDSSGSIDVAAYAYRETVEEYTKIYRDASTEYNRLLSTDAVVARK